MSRFFPVRIGKSAKIGGKVKRPTLYQILRFAASAAVVCAIILIYSRWLRVNPTTVGFTFLLAILVISASWGLRYAIFMAVLATLGYNYFFLPPLYQFTIADPQNWIALFAFLFTAIVASQLSERARSEAEESNERRSEVERLYVFSQALLVSDSVYGLLNLIPKYVVDSFGVTSAAMLVEGKEAYFYDVLSRDLFPIEQLKAISSRGEPVLDRERRLCFMPLRMGVRSVGAIGLAGCDLSRETMEAIGSLAAIAIERAQTVDKLTRAEAARESDRLRSILLDSVTHEFRTPLTAIKASAETLLSDAQIEPAQRKELLTVIDEESDRLNRLVGEAAEVAQLDSHQLELHFERHSIREPIDAALKAARQSLQRHPVDIKVPDTLPDIKMDGERIAEVLTHLLENAGKYSPPDTPIHVIVEQRLGGEIVTSVADHGPGIDDMEQDMIFEKFYRGRNQRTTIQGTGMGLAIAKAIVELHGGTIGVRSQVGHGSVFFFTLPPG
jgi:two-component system, OmpR family, sensor histidine kinase KdpD